MTIIKVKVGQRSKFEAIPGFVYCGRSFKEYDESDLHNPYIIGRDGLLQTVLSKYHKYLEESIEHSSAQSVAMRSLTNDSVLGCWCINKKNAGDKPWSCHCDIIASIWNKCFNSD